MIIHTANPLISLLLVPIMAAIWAIDVYIFLLAIRLILGKLSSDWAGRVCQGLQPFTDPVPQALTQRLAAWRRRPVPTWPPWLCVIGGAVAVRYLLLWIVVCCL